MKFLSASQSRAARGLLDWSQPDLAARCGMHVQTISQFEQDAGSPTKRTLQKITETFEAAGVEFLPNDGVCLSPNKIYILDRYFDVLGDVLQTLPDGGEMLLHCADEKRSPPEVIERMNELIKQNIKIRSTICEGNTFLREATRESKWIPKAYFADSEVFVIYADKFVIPIDVGTELHACLVIKNKTLADAMRRQFEYWWKHGTPVPETALKKVS